ncbi:MAG: hypothetical protein ACXADO_09920 [Candidatus Thorarchaeota archaeon]|jgi:hypothetical protein
MKRRHRGKILGIAALILTVFVIAGTSLASPNFEDECGGPGCHDTLGHTLSVNATGTIQAETGVPFVLIITAGSGAEAVSMQSESADNGEFTVSKDVVRDGDAEDTNANTGEIEASISFTPNSAGSFVIRIWTGSTGRIGRSSDVSVTVTQSTTTTTGTTTTTTTTGTTTTTDNGPSDEELIQIWEMMMTVFIPAAGVILVILGVAVIRRANAQ